MGNTDFDKQTEKQMKKRDHRMDTPEIQPTLGTIHKTLTKMSNTDLIKQKGKRSYDISQNQLYLSKCFEYKCVRGLGTIVMVFNATFNH